MTTPIDLDTLEAHATEQLEPAARDYFARGAGDAVTLAANLAAWSRIALRPRVLRNVAAVSTTCTVLGTELATPILVAPTAMHRFAHPDGELATARAAAAAGTTMVVSMASTTSVEDIATVAEWSELPVVVKGVLRADDARRCVDAGAAAVIVSNHGGRTLDGMIATADLLA